MQRVHSANMFALFLLPQVGSIYSGITSGDYFKLLAEVRCGGGSDDAAGPQPTYLLAYFRVTDPNQTGPSKFASLFDPQPGELSMRVEFLSEVSLEAPEPEWVDIGAGKPSNI